MDTVTYPTPAVEDLLRERFVCYSINEGQPTREDAELMRRCRLLWSPGMVFFEPRGAELRRFVGYRPADEFVAELHLVLGLNDMLYRRFEAAAQAFAAAALDFGEHEGAAEALYWRAIALYRAEGRNYDVLRRHWNEIRERFPDSTWWPRADVWDARPTGRRGADA
jgi:hypothetical protein